VAGVRPPDCFAAKKVAAKDRKYGFNQQTKKSELLGQEYEDPKAHEFRDLKEIVAGDKDFELRPRAARMENPFALTAFAEKPKYERER
jgi:hypothetical protein